MRIRPTESESGKRRAKSLAVVKLRAERREMHVPIGFSDPDPLKGSILGFWFGVSCDVCVSEGEVKG